MPRRKSYIDVKNEFDKAGYVLLDTTYKNSKTPLNYICSCGHSNVITYTSLRRGAVPCSHCNAHLTVKKTLEQVTEAFSQRGFKLLSTEYVNSHTPLQYQCTCGMLCTITYQSFNVGHQSCGRCVNEQRGKTRENTCLVKYGTKNVL